MRNYDLRNEIAPLQLHRGAYHLLAPPHVGFAVLDVVVGVAAARLGRGIADDPEAGSPGAGPDMRGIAQSDDLVSLIFGQRLHYVAELSGEILMYE